MEKTTQQVNRQSTVKSAYLKLACCFALAYLVLLALLYTPVYLNVVLRPDHQPSTLYSAEPILGISPKELTIVSHGQNLHAWLFSVPKSKTIVIVHHGNAGNILDRLFIAETFIKEGASVLLYDYRGYGKSTGPATLNNILADGLAVFDYAKSNYQYPITINYGESIGSSVACYVDSQRMAQGLILQSGIASLPNIARNGIALFFLYPDFIWPGPLLNNCALLAKSKTSLLLIHGNKDTLAPISNSDLLFAAAGAPDKSFVKLPDCGHNDVGLYDCELYQRAIGDFLKKKVNVLLD